MHKLSHRARARALVLAVSAAALALVIGGSGAGAATPTGTTQTITMEFAKGKMKFAGPASVTVGDQLEIVNNTNPKQIGPHTFSLVTKGSLPKTPQARKGCFAPKHICLAIAIWHGFNPKTERITKNLVKAGPAGWGTAGNATGKKGDSWFTEKKGEAFSQEVTAEAGSTLYYLCAVHPWMQGKVAVEAPIVPPLPTPTS